MLLDCTPEAIELEETQPYTFVPLSRVRTIKEKAREVRAHRSCGASWADRLMEELEGMGQTVRPRDYRR